MAALAGWRRDAVVHPEGRVRKLPAHEVVPGDLVSCEAGNVVPADLQLIEAARLTPRRRR